MRLSETISTIRTLNVPVFDGRDVAGVLGISPKYASTILHRLQDDNIVFRIAGNKWSWVGDDDVFVIGSYITAPTPSYISLQSALFHHGMISQIPATTYCVSLARTQKIKTSFGDFSVHHIQPDFFFGFEEIGSRGARVAGPEKALLDVLYLSPAKSRLFKKIPELDLPKGFSVRRCRQMIAKISSLQRRTVVTKGLDTLLGQVGYCFSRKYK